MSDERAELYQHWGNAKARHDWLYGHHVEWLRNVANQLALVNSLGATLAVALAAGMARPVFLWPATMFVTGALLVLGAAFFAHRGNTGEAPVVPLARQPSDWELDQCPLPPPRSVPLARTCLSMQ